MSGTVIITAIPASSHSFHFVSFHLLHAVANDTVAWSKYRQCLVFFVTVVGIIIVTGSVSPVLLLRPHSCVNIRPESTDVLMHFMTVLYTLTLPRNEVGPNSNISFSLLCMVASSDTTPDNTHQYTYSYQQHIYEPCPAVKF